MLMNRWLVGAAGALAFFAALIILDNLPTILRFIGRGIYRWFFERR